MPSIVDMLRFVRRPSPQKHQYELAFKQNDKKMSHPAIIRPPGNGQRIGVVGDTYRILATGEETGGKYAAIEALVPPGGGPPPHVHRREEESFFVLEGELTFQHDEERIVAPAGTFINMPIGSLHCFKNESNDMARMIMTVIPAGLEQMFLEVGQPLPDDSKLASPPSPEAIQKLLEAAPRYGVDIHIPEL